MSGPSDADGGIIGGAEDLKKAEKMAARQARFNNELEGNRYKEVCWQNTVTIWGTKLTHSLKELVQWSEQHTLAKEATKRRCVARVRACVRHTRLNSENTRPTLAH